jgi:hypothetical protein
MNQHAAPRSTTLEMDEHRALTAAVFQMRQRKCFIPRD